MYNDVVTVASLANPVEAEIVRNALRDAGIRCYLAGTLQGGVVGTSAIPIDVQVHAGDADHAFKLLQTHEHARSVGRAGCVTARNAR